MAICFLDKCFKYSTHAASMTWLTAVILAEPGIVGNARVFFSSFSKGTSISVYVSMCVSFWY